MNQSNIDLDFTSPLPIQQSYSSIDESPPPIGINNDILSNRLAKMNQQYLRSMPHMSREIILGKPKTLTDDMANTLPDIVQICHSTGSMNSMSPVNLEVESDQCVPEISKNQSLALPSNMDVSGDQCVPEISWSQSFVLPSHLYVEHKQCHPEISTHQRFTLPSNMDVGQDQNVPEISLSQSFVQPSKMDISYDQCVPELSMSEGSEQQRHLPNIHTSPNMYDNSKHEFCFPGNLKNEVYHKAEIDNNTPHVWRSTKLSSDKMEALKKALNCYSQCCPDVVCKKGRNLLDSLRKKIQLHNVVDCNERQILEYLLEHCENCTEYYCIAPGCNLADKSVDSIAELIDRINNENCLELKYSPNAKFYSFSSNCCVKCPQDVNETTMYSFPSPNSISIYHNNNKWAKITVFDEIMEATLPLLIKIGHLSNHMNILPIDWLINDQFISYSTDHYAEPLKYKLSFNGINKRQIILQLIDAALYLNVNKIAFLAWTTENICFRNGTARLTNFHMGSALLDDFDTGLIKSLLYPTVVPPEVNSKNVTLHKADVWGLSCLLYELITHKVVHSHLQHIERELVWRLLDENGWIPKYSFDDRRLESIFQKGWKENPEERISLEELKCTILNYRKDF